VPVQRKVFRIEESMHAHVREALPGSGSGETPREPDLVAELRALRALLEPQPASSDQIERNKTQIDVAREYKRELEFVHEAIKRTREELGGAAASPLRHPLAGRVRRELEAIVAGTEHATDRILKSAEDIAATARALSHVVKEANEKALASEIDGHVARLFEACNFQDLTGQRVSKVVEAMKCIEDHAASLMEIWDKLEQFTPIVLPEPSGEDRRFLNGPKLEGDGGHFSQDDVDAIFGRA